MYLEKIREMKETGNIDLLELDKIADEMEECLTPEEMWNILRPAMPESELIENLEYIARESDI